MAMLVWITLKVKDGNCNQVLELLDSPEGNDFTASQEGCERLERSVDHDNPNQILLTELWNSKENWDAYFEMQQEVRDKNGFNRQLLELIEENGIEIKFSEVNKSKMGNIPKHVQNILDEDEKDKHFLVVHTFVSDEARREVLTPPEKRNPPRQRDTERDWVEWAASGKHAKVVQHWITNEEFFYCHWVARNESDIYKQLEENNLEGKLISSMVQEAHQYVTAFRNSDTALRNYPENGMYW